MNAITRPPAAALALGQDIEQGRQDPRDLTEAFVSRIEADDPDHRIFYQRTFERARREAKAAHQRAQSGLRRSSLDGVPLAWKDLFDSADTPTMAGSHMLKDRTPDHDAEALARLTRAGAICLGKTAMTELAFSGLGINPVCGTPANAHDSETERVPGGSSSGAGVALARNMCALAIGTDTGGSVRIPAAWNGQVGFKPSHGRIPTKGVVPLCPTLDTVGPIATSVADASMAVALLSGEPAPALEDATLNGRTMLVPESTVFDECDPGIREQIHAALAELSRAGADIRHEDVPELTQMNALTWQSGISLPAIEAWSIWGKTIQAKGEVMYAPVRARFEGGAAPNAADAWSLMQQRKQLRASLTQRLASVDAIALPTLPIDPPPIADLVNGDAAYDWANRLALRNTTLGNQLDMCAITLPCGVSTAGLPVGLMLMAPKGRDTRLLRLAHAVERALG